MHGENGFGMQETEREKSKCWKITLFEFHQDHFGPDFWSMERRTLGQTRSVEAPDYFHKICEVQ